MAQAVTTLLLASSIAIGSFAHAATPQDEASEARAAIERANAEFSRAFAASDIKALAEMYTADAILFPPDSEMIRGNEAIGGFWKTAREGGITAATLTTIDVERSGETAYETGTVALTIEPQGKPASKAVEKYLVVWKRDAAGTWKLHRDIWNSLGPKK
jgi:ketosteroid isomerase-like protein